MHAVVRETFYPADLELADEPAFREFQAEHARQPGYRGTIVVALGNGRHITVTLWNTAEDMHAAREALGPTVGRLLEPMMTSSSHLLGTGPVVVKD
jgi:hypothetical protein